MFEIKKITKEEGHKIIETKEPLGLFWYKDNDVYVSIDNSEGEAFVEEFKYRSESHAWLKNCDKPVSEEHWTDVAGYCYHDVIATEKAFNHLQADWIARQRLIMKASMSSYHAEVKRVSELMTNMILSGASTEEMERVIDYSKDVLDAFKCELRCKQSKKDNNIDELVKRYGDEV